MLIHSFYLLYLIQKRYSLFIILFLGVVINVHTQTPLNGLILSNNEVSLVKSGLHIFKNDEVRGEVFSFQNSSDPILFENKRNKAITFTCWIRPQHIDKHPGTIFGEKEVFYFRYISNRQLQFNHYLKHDIDTKGFISEDCWQHVGFSISEKGNVVIYLNGEIVYQDSIASDWWKKKGDFVLGADLYKVASEGFVDDICVWDSVLPPNEIKQQFEKTLIEPELSYGLQLFMPFKADFKDYSGSGKEIIEVKDVFLVKDEQNKNGAKFYTEDSKIRIEGFTFDRQQTIAAWIKPDFKKDPQPLVGNTDFCLRYLCPKSILWFSVPLMYGIQSEYYGNNKDKWLHVAVSLNYNNRIDYYINGVKVFTSPIEGQTGKASYIELGKSIWGDNYWGLMSDVCVWNRMLTEKEINAVYQGRLVLVEESSLTIVLWVFVICILIFGVFVIYLKRTRFTNQSSKRHFHTEESSSLVQKSAIYLFNSFKAFSDKGKDVSSEFSPTLIRLLTIIIIYPKVFNKNVSSSELSDLLWPNDENIQQKNNRNANIHRLRTLLKYYNGLELQFKNKEWVFEYPEGIFIDINEFEGIIDRADNRFVSMKLDKNLYEAGLDLVVQNFTDKVINLLVDRCKIAFRNKENDRLLILSQLWLSVDSLSDEAIKYQVSALMKLGRKQRALSAFKAFAANYNKMLNEDYSTSFESLIQ